MLGGKREQGNILNHGSMAEILPVATSADALRREMFCLGRRDEDAASLGCEAKTEVEVFAAYPEIGAMEAGIFDDIAAHEQTNALCPVELCYFRAEAAAVFGRFIRSL